MKRAIRIIILIIGALISMYGALKDYEPVTLIGAFLIVVGLMFTAWFNFSKK